MYLIIGSEIIDAGHNIRIAQRRSSDDVILVELAIYRLDKSGSTRWFYSLKSRGEYGMERTDKEVLSQKDAATMVTLYDELSKDYYYTDKLVEELEESGFIKVTRKESDVKAA